MMYVSASSLQQQTYHIRFVGTPTNQKLPAALNKCVFYRDVGRSGGEEADSHKSRWFPSSSESWAPAV